MTLLLGSAANTGLMSEPYGPSGAPPGSPARSLSTESRTATFSISTKNRNRSSALDGTIVPAQLADG